MGNKIKIGNRYLGDDQPLYLVAEIGINHNGDLQIAKKLIDAAWVTNWDCVKFQKRTPSICVPEDQKNVIRQTPWGEMTYLDYKNKIEFQRAEYDCINKYCKDKPIDWTASVWDIPSLEFVLKYDVPFLKIASAMLTNSELIEASAKSGRPIFLSTGMSTLAEIDSAVEILERVSGRNYVLFHTNSTYPAKLDELNLQMIRTLKERYGCLVGYSGHEYELEPTMLVPVYGACAIERHITLSHNMWGTDHAASLEITGMYILENRLRSIKTMIGDGIKIITEGEKKIREKLKG